MSHKIITCAGFGNTGSSAVTNFFEEFSNVFNIGSSGFEFLFLHETDGIIDLYKSLIEGNRLKSDLAIKRFINLVYTLNFQNPAGPDYRNFFNGHFLEYTKDYLESLNIIIWDGEWYRNNEIIKININDSIVKKYLYNKKMAKNYYNLYEPDTWRPSFTYRNKMYFCHLDENEFVIRTKSYLNRLIEECDINNEYEYIYFDQLVPSNCNNMYTQFFDNLFVIRVDRDPRDLYFANKIFWNNGYIPSINADIYIDWYKRTRKNTFENDKILNLKFEDLIFNYDKTTDLLINYVKTDKNKHIKKGFFLKPEQSINNTLLWLRYSYKNVEIYNDIKRIENELSDYCYNYTSEEIKNINIINQDFSSEKINSEVNELRICFLRRLFIASYINTKLKNYKCIKNFILFPFDFLKQLLKSFLREIKYKYVLKNKFDFFDF